MFFVRNGVGAVFSDLTLHGRPTCCAPPHFRPADIRTGPRVPSDLCPTNDTHARVATGDRGSEHVDSARPTGSAGPGSADRGGHDVMRGGDLRGPCARTLCESRKTTSGRRDMSLLCVLL